ncbi:site-specific integrase [Heyndrickxia oleronia]|uniref:tyrosine-type recombinase/integrase n=1 Tax=Heyndrickxia oleronia TaxID=38875 RepID=UPI00333725E7
MQGGVRKRGDNWYYYFEAGKVNGKRKKIERKGGSTKKEAQIALRNAIAEFEQKGNTILESNISASDYLDYWFKNYVLINCKYNTQQYYRGIIDNHIKPYFGSYKLKQISSKSLQEFLNKKFLDGFSKSSISNFNGVLQKAFRMAVDPYNFIKKNPASSIHLPKFDESLKDDKLKVISRDDFYKIIARFPEGSSFYIPLQIAFHTGMRASEVCGLTWDYVDLDKRIIKVRQILILKGSTIEFGTPKTTSSNRDILIGETLVDILKKHKKRQEKNKQDYQEHYMNSNFVCTKENGQVITMNTLKYLSRVVNYELCINFNFHSLRHTHATMLLESGANPKDVQKRLGHNRIATTLDTYSHVTETMEKSTINLFEQFLKK